MATSLSYGLYNRGGNGLPYRYHFTIAARYKGEMERFREI
jgi:hypothetical protein